jgi:amino acid adenylation domain-containing protein
VPFEYLVKELQPERNLAQNPLIQVMLSLEPPLPTLPSGWTMTLTDVDTRTSKFDLSVELDDRPEGLVGWFEYSTDLFDQSTIVRMVGHWQILLDSIVHNPDLSIDELSLLTEAERRQVGVEWNDTAVDYPKDLCLHQMFEAQVARTPDAVAVVFENECLTYQELNSKANQLAYYLQEMEVGPEVLVGVCMKRSLEMVVALLAILKAGGAYVPLDPTYPQERLAFMLQDAQVPVLLTQQQLVESLPQHMSSMICLDTDWQAIAQRSEENPASRVMPKHLAYVLYTSGSTGRPKGVAIEHRNVVAFVQWATSVFTHEDLAGVLASTSICFDLSIFELFVPLICGETVQLIENVLHLPDISLDRQVTLVNTVPSALAQVLRTHRLPASVRTVNLAGEPLSNTLTERIYSQSTVQRVFNLYGPTETTTYSTYTQVEKGTWETSIGRPIANTQVYILDAHLQPVPIGVVGELYIGGNGVARGYLNRPELTAQRFIPDPFSQKSGTRLYKTGDLCRYRPDGTIEFLGRNDSLVKIHGFRIEPGEIEEVLKHHPQVQEAVVVTREDTAGEKQLVAYVVGLPQHTTAITSLRDFLKEQLPGYMVPAAFVLLPALPRTPNGKLDRHALPAPASIRRTTEESFVAPTSLVHYQLMMIWEELLDVSHIGIRDNFFLLGGHSFLAARLVDRIEQVFAKKIALPTLFAGPTIEQLATALLQQEESNSRSPIVKIQGGKTKRPFFFLHGDYKGGPFYCFPLARGLGSDQPFYALAPYRFDGLRIPPTLEAMASSAIDLIRSVQSEGPYLLGGFCGGGLVAYEVARQLSAQGQRVDLLVLMDPTPVGYLRWVRRVINHFGNLMRLSHEKQLYWFLWLQHIYRYLRHLYRYLRFPRYRRLQTELKPEEVSRSGGAILTLEHLHELRLREDTGRWGSDEQVEFGHRGDKQGFALPRLDAIFPDAIFPPTEVLCHDWAGLFYWSASDYVPDLYPGTSTFFFFWDSEERGREAKWRKVAEARDEQVEIHILPGTHDTCKTEHLQDLTERLRMCLSQTRAVH